MTETEVSTGGGLIPLLNLVQPRATAPVPPRGLDGFTPNIQPKTYFSKLWETAVPTTFEDVDANGNVWNYERVEGVAYLRSIDVKGVPDAMKGTITMTNAPEGMEAASKYETPGGDVLVMQGGRGEEKIVEMDVGIEWARDYRRYLNSIEPYGRRNPMSDPLLRKYNGGWVPYIESLADLLFHHAAAAQGLFRIGNSPSYVVGRMTGCTNVKAGSTCEKNPSPVDNFMGLELMTRYTASYKDGTFQDTKIVIDRKAQRLTLSDIAGATIGVKTRALPQGDEDESDPTWLPDQFWYKIYKYVLDHPEMDKEIVTTPRSLIHYTMTADVGGVALVDYSSGETVSYVRNAKDKLEFSAKDSSAGAVPLDPSKGGLLAIQAEVGNNVAEILTEEYKKYKSGDKSSMFYDESFSDDSYLALNPEIADFGDQMATKFTSDPETLKRVHGLNEEWQDTVNIIVILSVILYMAGGNIFESLRQRVTGQRRE